MEFIKQNASGLYVDVQKIGCFFRAACHMAEMKANKALTITQINDLWALSKKLKYIDVNNDVVTSAPIANLAAEKLGLKGRFTEVAVFSGGKMNWYGSVQDKDRRADFYIQKIGQNGPSKTHFINVDKYGTLIWDPHDPDINKTGVYYTICYRFEER